MSRFSFRAWNSKSRAWQHKEPCDLLGEMILLGGWMSGVPIIDLNHMIIMQSTGFKDKNGDEIFEGDIVLAGIKDDIVKEFAFQVEYMHGKFFITRRNSAMNAISIEMCQYYAVSENAFTIIGNIFDNPDMVNYLTY